MTAVRRTRAARTAPGRALVAALGGAVLGIALAGCTGLPAPRPAVLVSDDPASLAGLKRALAEAMGRPSIELGPGDPTRSPALSVLPQPPGPYEDRSLALPTSFRLELVGERCFVVRADGGARREILGAGCRPA